MVPPKNTKNGDFCVFGHFDRFCRCRLVVGVDVAKGGKRAIVLPPKCSLSKARQNVYISSKERSAILRLRKHARVCTHTHARGKKIFVTLFVLKDTTKKWLINSRRFFSSVVVVTERICTRILLGGLFDALFLRNRSGRFCFL